MKKIIVTILISSMLIMPLVGCWDMREINELGLVMAVGVDKAVAPNNFKVTVQIANPKPVISNAEQINSISEPYWVLTAEGKTIFDAIRELTHVSSRRIMWAHNNIVIIGEELAKQSITPVVDFFSHNPELRMQTLVVVSKGNAKEYMGSKVFMENNPGTSLAGIFGLSKLLGESIESNFLKLDEEFYGEFSQPSLSIISFKNSKILPEEVKTQKQIDTVQLAGVAIFKKDKMIGMIAPNESQGIAWVLNQAKSTIVSAPAPEQQNKYASVEMIKVKSKITTEVIKGMPSVAIKISGTAEIVEEDGFTNLNINEYKKKLEGYVANTIKKDVETSVNKAQKEFKSDILGFSNYIHVQHKKEWDNLSSHWDTIYPKMPITVTAKIIIINSSLSQTVSKDAKQKGE